MLHEEAGGTRHPGMRPLGRWRMRFERHTCWWQSAQHSSSGSMASCSRRSSRC